MRRWALALLGLGLAGCASDPAGVEWARLEGPRFLAMQSSPTVANSNDFVGLESLIVDGHGDQVAAPITWRACNPWQPIVVTGRDCGPEQSLPLRGAWYLTDVVLAAFPPDRGLPQFFDIPIIAEVTVEGRQLVALKEVRTTRDQLGGRSNPRIAALLLDGRANDGPLEPGRTYSLQVSLNYVSIDVVDDGNGNVALEQVDVHVYATAGDVSRSPIRYRGGTIVHDRIDAATFTVPMDPGAEIAFWLVAVDGDGGTGWRSFSAQVGALP